MNHINTIFILGYPRSGTTWFANLFNSHPDVVYRHELIGRRYKLFPKELFNKLKFNYGLNDSEYQQAISIILTPDVETDRAPFFSKNHLTLGNPTFHYFNWIISKTIRFYQPIYKYIFRPRGPNITLILKETRSTMNMDSIMDGIRSDKNIILFRHPCGAIASSLNGISTGKMQPSTDAQRNKWFGFHKEREYIKELGLNESTLLSLPEHEYLAILWRLQNEDYLEYSSSSNNNIYINYEDFMIDQQAKFKRLFAMLPLNYDSSVNNFILDSSGVKSTKLLMKDSSSNFYSVYKSKSFDPDKWKNTLTAHQISDIEKHTLNIFNRLLGKTGNQP